MEEKVMGERPGFFDAHTHVQFGAFDVDRDEVMRLAREAGVRMINVGTQRDTSAAAIALAEKYDGVYAAVGLHPVHTTKSFHDAQELGGGEAAKAFTSRGEAFDAAAYRALARHPRVVAIGECGLDYFRFSDVESREEQVKKQKAAFTAQIALAREVGKPLMIHCRNAFADLIELLRREADGLKPGVIHFFTGTPDDARALFTLGFSFTFGGVVTFARNYDEAIKMIPLGHILSETDAPYVAPVPYRGKRNEPAYVAETVKKLAELKNISLVEMATQINENAKRIFSID
ncbi:MAG TPA: TatD family hydrolase [Candidatus Paceibacterota bacterium]|jgi:TatD DNase family protein|nr:TatD family hydrolase [Candidatus Paceibacterota bacterium]